MKIMNLIFFFSISISFFIYPMAENVMMGMKYEAMVTPQVLYNIDANHRDLLEQIIREAYRRDTGEGRLIALGRIGMLNSGNRELNAVFMNMGISLTLINKDSVGIYQQLVPTVSLMQQYFNTLIRHSSGLTHKIFTRMNRLFRSTLFLRAWELYQEALSLLRVPQQEQTLYMEMSVPQQALQLITRAQALLFHLKDTSIEARALYDQLDTYQPVPFAREAQAMATMMTGGMMEGG
ncbi:MAG: hypothetical protein WDZ41_00815 [Candidatus Babeliales bacterium]